MYFENKCSSRIEQKIKKTYFFSLRPTQLLYLWAQNLVPFLYDPPPPSSTLVIGAYFWGEGCGDAKKGNQGRKVDRFFLFEVGPRKQKNNSTSLSHNFPYTRLLVKVEIEISLLSVMT